MTWRVIYKDAHNNTYSAPAKKHGEKWMMLTSDDGWKPISSVFRDDRAGNLLFDHYQEDVPPAESETLHVVGQGFKALQDVGARATAEYRTERAQQRRGILDALNQPNTEKIAEARAHATALAQLWNPKRPEPIPPTQLTKEHLADAEHSRLINHKNK